MRLQVAEDGLLLRQVDSIRGERDTIPTGDVHRRARGEHRGEAAEDGRAEHGGLGLLANLGKEGGR